MKRLFVNFMTFAAMATALTFTACSSDSDGDDNGNGNGGRLPLHVGVDFLAYGKTETQGIQKQEGREWIGTLLFRRMNSLLLLHVKREKRCNRSKRTKEFALLPLVVTTNPICAVPSLLKDRRTPKRTGSPFTTGLYTA